MLPPLPPGVGFAEATQGVPYFTARTIDPADATGWDAVRAGAWSYAFDFDFLSGGVLVDYRSSMQRAP